MIEAINISPVSQASENSGGVSPLEGMPDDTHYSSESFRQPVAEMEPLSPRSRLPFWLPVAVALIFGICLGVLIMRQRNHGRRVVAAVNGVVITQDALFNRLQSAAGAAVIHKMVEEDLQVQFAQKLGVAPSDAAINAQYDKDSQAPGFLQELAAKGVSSDDYKNFLRINLAQEGVITQGITVSDAEARQYYLTQIDSSNPKAQFYRPEAISLRAIGTPSQIDIRNAAKSLAENTPFDLVAGTYSKDLSKDNGGLLPALQRGRSPLSIAPALEQAVFALNVGQQLGPVLYRGQWWIFKCINKSPGGVIPYAQVVSECRRGARLHKGLVLRGQKIQTQFTEFQRGASIQAFWPQYEQAVHGN